ncbi:uncharacterized protein RCC_03703 [Ramularia collo-cygni]|uniref:Uncharacterized protein n=1 Tax=Ramularia collo-cygni TaxID=112498 RepID=A0A2D3UZN1_9PEZI|nr:uncharacterized protein RCC_03703 [Ramularia collo-cygni]
MRSPFHSTRRSRLPPWEVQHLRCTL